MRITHRNTVCTAIAAIAVAAAALVIPGSALADTGTVRYVSPSATCSDSGPGTSAEPFCSLQSALNIVNPGDIVAVTRGDNNNVVPAITFSRSGTAAAPITIESLARLNGAPSNGQFQLGEGPLVGTVSIVGVHDINIFDLSAASFGGDNIAVANSQNISIDSSGFGAHETATHTPASLHIEGTSSGISLTRSEILGDGGMGVRVDPGSSNVVVSTNQFYTLDAAVSASGTTHLAVTSNNIETNCGPAVTVDSASTGAIENNFIVTAPPLNPPVNPSCGAVTAITVAANSIAGMGVDYNAYHMVSPDSDYKWAGTAYGTPAAFKAATGKGGHDLNVGTKTIDEGSPLIDSADSNAVGELAIDYDGQPRRNDPTVANTGTGSFAYYDRGATELQDPIVFTPAPASALAGLPPFATNPVSIPKSLWGEQLTSTVSFGDGTPNVTGSVGPFPHTYAATGNYEGIITSKDSDGNVQDASFFVRVATTNPPHITLSTSLWNNAYESYEIGVIQFVPDSDVASGNEFASYSLDFGDGTTPSQYEDDTHSYAKPGYYTATLTATDVIGRKAVATTRVAAGLGFNAVGPIRDYDSRKTQRIQPHQVLRLSATQLHAVGASAVVLTTTVTGPARGGYLTVYPDGGAMPNASTLNFAANQTIANQTTAMVGSDGYVDFYNGSPGVIDLVVDTFGTQTFNYGGATYLPAGPSRVLDTRYGIGVAKGSIAAGHTVTLDLNKTVSVPAGAKDAIVNLTTTDTGAGGYLSAYPPGASTTTSVSNWAKGQTVANLVVLPVTNGQIVLKNNSSASVDFVADLSGYYANETSIPNQTVYVPNAPTRILDTRYGIGSAIAKVGPGQTISVPINTFGTTSGIAGAQMNITATQATAGGYLIVYPGGSSQSNTSALNYTAGTSVANAGMVPLGADHTIKIYNGGSKSVDVIIDLEGTYYRYPAS